jgi:hypothetical protein
MTSTCPSCPKCSHPMSQHVEAAGVEWCLVPGCQCRTIDDVHAYLRVIIASKRPRPDGGEGCNVVLGRVRCAHCHKMFGNGTIVMLERAAGGGYDVVHNRCRWA